MEKDCQKPCMVHYLLSRSYSVYLFSIIVGLILDTLYPIHFSGAEYSNLGFLFMCIGTIFIYWAQKTSSNSKKKFLADTNTPRNFALGPYKYSRNPTYIGLMFASCGFGLMIGSFFVIALCVFSFITTKLVFLPREEEMLEQKYGNVYLDYKKKVHPWI